MQQISLNIPDELYKEVVANRWRHGEIYALGVNAKKNNPQLLERIQQLEKAHKDSLTRIARLQNQVWAMEQESISEVSK